MAATTCESTAWSDDVDARPESALDDAATARLLTNFEPGPLAMMMLQGLEPDAADESALIDVAHAWERQLAWVSAKAQETLARVADAPPPNASGPVHVVPPEELRAELLAASLRWSPCTAGYRLEAASRLVQDLPHAFALLESGDITARHTRELLDAITDLSTEQARDVEARVLAKAPTQTVAEFRRAVRRAVIAVAPDLVAARRAQAVAQRGVQRQARPDGMATLIATMSAPDADTVWLALDAVARKAAATAAAAAAAAGDPDNDAAVPIDARRADALLAWANHALAEPGLPRRQGRKVEIQVVVDLPTLLAMADNPAELVGYGPIPAQAARELASDARWRRLVVEPVTGHLLDYGTSTYRPPQALLDYVITRDRRCRFPGCGRRADSCDVDHVCPAARGKPGSAPGGKTAACNCCTLCRRHHRIKTHGRWRLRLLPDTTCIWTAPGGQQFTVDPTGQLR